MENNNEQKDKPQGPGKDKQSPDQPAEQSPKKIKEGDSVIISEEELDNLRKIHEAETERD